MKKHGALEVPAHLRNASTQLMRQEGWGDGYVYPHERDEAFAADQRYLPEVLRDSVYYQPRGLGYEAHIKTRLETWAQRRAEVVGSLAGSGEKEVK